jgi:hypothetical protein
MAARDCENAISKFTSSQLDMLADGIFEMNSFDDIKKFTAVR